MAEGEPETTRGNIGNEIFEQVEKIVADVAPSGLGISFCHDASGPVRCEIHPAAGV